ncbi:AAA family ATPase [Psychroserpens algicola]|uniref:AAA family ATPase n=1 Tax=Psychroserpens algicola TaxID=1719034 RepID=UPI001953C86B|nr:AAA family ATPase [Psychroserpens algicola]
MIHIDRNRIEKPSDLNPNKNSRLEKEMLEAEQFFKSAEQTRGQRRFRFKAITSSRTIKNSLIDLFHGKCAYCETKIQNNNHLDLEHYRPKSSVLESQDHPGYWWLAHDWDNLLVACNVCNRSYYSKSGKRGKANRFPLLDESKRAFSPKNPISKETPLILNPCVDEPENHLTYTDDGKVSSRTKQGQTSIMVLGLNRPELVEARKKTIVQINNHINRLFRLTKSKRDNKASQQRVLDYLNEQTKEHQEFAGLKRQYIKAALEEFNFKIVDAKSLESTLFVTNQFKQETKHIYEDFSKNVESLSVNANVEQNMNYLLLEHFVEKIELTNIKTFKKQCFDFTASEGAMASWLMLLGENGTGKSTVLKSLCMNLCDGAYFQNMVNEGFLNPAKFIRYKTKKGIIKVWMTSKTQPRVLEFTKNLVKFTNTDGESVELKLPLQPNKINTSAWQSPTYLLAYGATRLLPRGSKHEAKHINSQFSRLDNLFNPFVPLVDAENWLLGLDSILFRRAAIVLKDLLNMKDDEKITRRGGVIKIIVNNSVESFQELSDGYQSVIALTADILQLVMDRWKNPDEARGIVLVDEIGAHLHPRWKMRIVSSLRTALPNMQFIVSSHQPLCLRGLDKNEVILMRRDAENNVEVITDLPNPKELRISQILTSVFGLSSTMDPELEAEFNRYYDLRAMNKRTEEEEQEMITLRNELNPDLLLGETVLDTQVYNVIKEKYKDYKNDTNLSDLDKLSKETISAAQELWNSDL